MKRKTHSISIMSLEAITELLSSKKTLYNIVSIRSTDLPELEYKVFEDFKGHYKEIIIEVFDDIESPWTGKKVVDPKQIAGILNWAKGKNNIVVHCTAGISRSAAVAYLIACTRMIPAEAVKILKTDSHYPNDLVVYYGAKILGDDSIYTEYYRWLDKADEACEDRFSDNDG
ncbi:MAG: hypothetical protein WC637_22450 [Victivallales bacterium]|jgi:predicted protein tyrosine phosphatase